MTLADTSYEPTGLGTTPWLQDGSTVASITTANSHSGDWSFALTSQLTGYWVGVSETLTELTIGRDYTISAWVDASATTGLSDISLGVDGDSASADTSGWQLISKTFTADATTVEWNFGHNDASPTSGAVYWDDFSFVQDAYTDGSGSHAEVPLNGNNYELDGFGETPWLNDGSTVASLTTANSNSGEWSLALTSRLTGYWVGMWDTLTDLTIGTTYTLSAWVDASATTGLSGISLGIDGDSALADTSGWQQIDYTFTAEATSVEWGFGHNDASPTSGAVYWDDMKLEAEGEPLSPDVDIVLDLGNLESFEDSNGNPVDVTSDESDVAERTVVGTTFDGDPFEIKVFSTLPLTVATAEDLENLVVNPPTQSPGGPDEVDEDDLVPTLATAVTPSTMTLAWDPVDGGDAFSVSISGALVAEGSEPNFTLRDLQPGATYDVELRSTHVVADPPVDPYDIPTDTLMQLQLRTPEQLTEMRRGGSISSLFDRPGSDIRSTEFNYRTFIPYETLLEGGFDDRFIVKSCLDIDANQKIPDFGEDQVTFLGDNRGFQPPSPGVIPDYRTMMNYRIEWGDGLAVGSVDTGPTSVYDVTEDTVIASDHASTANMVFNNRALDAGYATVTFDHVANDPFCPAIGEFGAIVYHVRFDAFQSGPVFMSGIRSAMPAHEAYVRWNDETSWTRLALMEARGLKCLVLAPWISAPACADRFVSWGQRSSVGWRDVSIVPSSSSTWDPLPATILAATTGGGIWGTGSNSGEIFEPFTDDPLCVLRTYVPVPVRYEGYSGDTERVLVSRTHGTFMNSDGLIYTWGDALDGGAYLGHAGPELAPVSTMSFVDFDLSFDGRTTYAVTEDGDLYSWGYRVRNRDLVDYDYNFTPTLEIGGYNLVSVRLVGDVIIALDDAGHLWGYGDNYQGVLGAGTPGWTAWGNIPVPGVTFASIGIVNDSAFALDTDGQLWGWGQATLALEGIDIDHATDPVTTPTLVDTELEFSRIDDGAYELGALSTDGDAYSWNGYSYYYLPIAGAALPSWSEDLVLVRDLHAITESGELLGLYGAEWRSMGLPPTKITDPPMTCDTLS